jgi:single-stranded-DNA-specific exonuclease
LKSTDPVEARESAKRLIKLNNERKIMTAVIVKDIKKKLSKKDLPAIIVSGNPKWKPSILGLVAGNLADEFGRPVFLWGRNGGGEIRGSCRSDQQTDVFALMQALPKGFLERFGGHKFSGGFGLSNDNIHFLEEKLLKGFKESGGGVESDEVTLIDGEISLKDIDWDLVNEIEKLSPFGAENPKPVFILRNVQIPEIKKFGKHNEHLKLDFSNGSKSISAISFFSDEKSFQKPLNEGATADLIASIEKSYFRNIPELRLRIIDIN